MSYVGKIVSETMALRKKNSVIVQYFLKSTFEHGFVCVRVFVFHFLADAGP